MEVYALLKKDHSKVKGIFAELDGTTERAVKKRETLFADLKMELTLHAEAEEKFFYSRLEDPKESRAITLEALEEHNVVKTLLAELEVDPKGTEEWAAKLTVLKENVEHHVKEEEGELFKSAKKVLSAEDAEAIAEEIEAFKAEATLSQLKE